MIVAQVAVAVVIATAAGLLVRSFRQLEAVDRGFNARNLAVVKLVLPDAGYPSPPARERFYERLLPKLAALPGATSATTVHLGPGTGQAGLSARMIFDGQTPDEARNNPYGTWEPIMPSYFATLGIPITNGRAFADADDGTAAPVAIVSESVAQRYWPGQNPIGKRLKVAAEFVWTTVVGVAADTRYRELTRDWLTVYFPAKQFFFFSPGAVVVRTAGAPVGLLPAIRRTIHGEEPAAAVHSVETMEKMVAAETARQRTAVAVATLFAFIAIFVAAIGVYGVVSYEIVHRARELAVHSALGASPGRILWTTLRQSVSVAAVGAAVGVAAASMLTRFLRTLLFEVSHLDVTSFVLAGAGLLTIVLLASAVPARRAARVNPALLLRSE
jgi:putative ABC transport system permease protein